MSRFNDKCTIIQRLWVMLLVTMALSLSHTVLGESCHSCHSEKTKGFSQGHAFAAKNCTTCHGGNANASEKETAHQTLIAFPGNLSNAQKSCGTCHAKQVSSVADSFMHTGKGMVFVTRAVFDENDNACRKTDLSHLTHTPADTLLRKLCASCHLGHDKTKHALDPLKDRGGGCLACHINAYPEHAHPALTTKVSSERCFGCHSRSSRISLNYAGLGEVIRDVQEAEDSNNLRHLDDGRWMERKPLDVHHKAGMDCIDCHTVIGLKGSTKAMMHREEAVDITCRDCHNNTLPRLRLDDWPEKFRSLFARIPFKPTPDQLFLTTARFGTPLWNIALQTSRENRTESLYLHRKNGDERLEIPQYSAQSHMLSQEHQRLTCAACHSQWAPQCYGCHLSYSNKGRQWDHMEKKGTRGRWRQKRWDFRHGLPTLGVTSDNRISPFIPGMITTIEHPEWERPKFRRLFASTSPHTIGKSRTCISCHGSPLALGLGEGQLTKSGDAWTFEAKGQLLADGLPTDAWVELHSPTLGRGSRSGERSFTQQEIKRILDAELTVE